MLLILLSPFMQLFVSCNSSVRDSCTSQVHVVPCPTCLSCTSDSVHWFVSREYACYDGMVDSVYHVMSIMRPRRAFIICV